MKKQALFIILIIVVAVIGFFVGVDVGKLRLGKQYYQNLHNLQLGAIHEALEDYRSIHGKYPNNEIGLNAIVLDSINSLDSDEKKSISHRAMLKNYPIPVTGKKYIYRTGRNETNESISYEILIDP